MLNEYDIKISHPETFKQLSIKDVLFLYYFCPQVDQQIQLFTHYNSIIFTLDGERKLISGQNIKLVGRRSTLFTRKLAFTQILTDIVTWEVVAFYFKDDFLRQIFNEFRPHLPLKNLQQVSDEVFIDLKINEATEAFFYSIVPYFSQKSPPANQLLELKFKGLLYDIFTNPGNAKFLAYVNSIMDQHKTPIRDIMESNYMYHLTVSEYARMADRSVSTFKRDFREHYNTTPGKWLTNKRLGHAKLLLETSKKNISEITYDSGFENISHFSRVFKKSYGISPLQYRNQ